jgi:hypothetical protein
MADLHECIFVQHPFEPIACEGDDVLMDPQTFVLKCKTRIHDLAVALSKRYGGYWQFWALVD